MAQINDPVAEEIALDFGKLGQVVGADLQPVIVETVGVEPYRVRILNFRDSFTPVGAVAGAVQFTLTCPKTESFRVVQGSLGNATSEGLVLTSFVRPAGGGAGQKLFQPLFRRMPAGAEGVIVGPGFSLQNTNATEQWIPAFIDMPSGSEFTVFATSQGGPFNAAPIGIAFQVLRLPKTREWSAEKFSFIAGPT